MMLPLLAMEIDIVALGSLFTALLSSLAVISGGVWKACSVIWAWFISKANPVVDAHKTMVETLNTEMPKVAQTLAALKDTQIQQCKQLDSHSEALQDIRTELKRSNDNLKPPGT